MLSTLHSRYFTAVVILSAFYSIAILTVTVSTVEDEISQVQNAHASAFVEAIYLNIENAYKTFLLYHSQELKNFERITKLKLGTIAEIARHAMAGNENQIKILSDLYPTLEMDENQFLWIVLHPFQEKRVFFTQALTSQAPLELILENNNVKENQINKTEYDFFDIFSYYDTEMDILYCISTSYKSSTNYTIDNFRENIKKELSLSFSNIRIGKSGYLFIFNDEYIFEIHPSVEGKDIRKLVNPDTGGILADELIMASKDPHIAYEYLWNKPNDPENFIYRKKAYVYYFKPFEWYIAASFYQEDIDKPIRSIRIGIYITSLIMLIISLIPIYLITFNLSKSLRHLKNVADSILLHGRLDEKIPILGTIETKQLGIALNDMMKSIRETNEKLIHIHKMETVGSLAGGTAHDLNNLLCGIIGSVSVLQLKLAEHPEENEEIGKYLTIIEKSSQKASDTVVKLLSLSRKNKPVMERTDFRLLLIETLDVFRTSSQDKEVEIIEFIPQCEFPILCDRNQLEQVILNLLINAKHAVTIMRPDKNQWGGSISVRLSTTEISNDKNLFGLVPGPYYQLEIEDTGVGMDEETLRKLFDPFFTTKGEEKGTGLGLSLVFNIIKLHNGSIDVSSTYEKGSIFTLKLPQLET